MRVMLWLAGSLFALWFAAGANAQKTDWRIFAEPFVTSAHAPPHDIGSSNYFMLRRTFSIQTWFFPI
jgi:hypothetical protein